MATLKEQIREAARIAEEISAPDEFNAMSWLDLAIEDNPESFDSLFDRTWNELSEEERVERAASIRKVL